MKIRGHRNASKMWFENKVWSRDEFLGRYGAKNYSFKVPYGGAYGEKSIRMTLQEFARGHMGKDFISALGQQRTSLVMSLTVDTFGTVNLSPLSENHHFWLVLLTSRAETIRLGRSWKWCPAALSSTNSGIH